MHEFFNSVGLFGSSRDTALMSDEELRFEPCQTMGRHNSSSPHNEVKIARLHQQMHFYITFAFRCTYSNVPVLANSVVIHEAQLTQKSLSNQAAFCWAT